MAGKTRTAFMGGEGSVKMPSGKSKGLRNKRKSYWAKIHQTEIREKERRAKARERADQFDFTPNYDF